MSDEVYKKLAEVFRSFPNGFPETKSGIEIRMLKRMFTQEEAEFLSELRQFETAASMAEKFGASEEDTLSNRERRLKLRHLIGNFDRPLDLLTCTSAELAEALAEPHSFTSQIVREGRIIYGRLN